MPFHFCWDEVVALTMTVPFVGYGVMRARHAWHRLWHRGSPKADGCCTESEHTHKEDR